ncbi:2-aminoethanethiol dioxygenase [Bradysia coprophila]|uniref:2-aminoethanethiol dioxygenase n=1 Tax=Bradysia coprophila TaxID=38358 RepID=UPI00187DC308|nr:2-aminoethanethiol dioxygenase [Bradysia coprophila]
MSSRFAQILKHAIITCHPNNAHSFKTNFNDLKILLDSLTISDLGPNLSSHLYSKNSFVETNKAPCTFVNIFENENLVVNIFILKERYTMPIHDHPMIHGILKGMAGKLLVESYTASNNDEATLSGSDEYGTIIMATKETPMELSEYTDCATLSPNHSQFHRITSLEGPAVLFDILTPPYEADIPVYGPRNCSYYRQVVLFDDEQFQHLGLEQIPPPSHFYCDTGHYKMPQSILDELNSMEKS